MKMIMNTRSLNGFRKLLPELYTLLHNENKDGQADRVHKLYEDCMFDRYITLPQAKGRLVRILK